MWNVMPWSLVCINQNIRCDIPEDCNLVTAVRVTNLNFTFVQDICDAVQDADGMQP
jgi:hypothetical protein